MRIFPQQGTIDNLIERLADYIQTVDKSWFKKIKPATSEQIENLRTISGIHKIGLDFPPAYYTFLKHMGQDDGGLLESEWDGFSEVSINSIIEYYRNEIDDIKELNLPPLGSYNLVFLDHWTEAILYFDLKQGLSPQIYSPSKLKSQSFENYLFQRAFNIIETKYYPFAISEVTSPHQMEILLNQREFNKEDASKSFWKEPWFTDTSGNSIRFMEILFEKLGFEKLWFSDAVNYCGVFEDISVMVHGADGLSICLTGTSKKQIDNIGKKIKNYLSLDKKYFEFR